MSDEEAKKIYQTNLDGMSEVMISGDTTNLSRYVHFPFIMRTVNSSTSFNTEADLAENIKNVHKSLRRDGFTDYIRCVRQAEFINDALIEGVHTTHILQGSTYLTPVFESRMRMTYVDNRWKVAVAENSIESTVWPFRRGQSGDGKLCDIDLMVQADKVATQTYQSFLDALTETNLNDDVDAWMALCAFPHHVKIDTVERTLDTPEAVLPFLDMVRNLLKKEPQATFRRTASFATSLDSHTIRGYHLTTLRGPEGDVISPVRSRMTIRLIDRGWKMIEVINSIANKQFPYEEPIVSDTPRSELQDDPQRKQ